MRELEFKIDEALAIGLTPYDTTPINTPVLNECLGFKIGKGGIELYQALESPLSSLFTIDYSWPFPRIFAGEKYNFLVMRDSTVNMEDKVYSIADDFTITHIFSVDELTFGLGTLMEVADFGSYAFMTNGVIMIYWDTAINDWHEIVASPTIPMMRTVCNFKGQAVGGNIVSAWHDCDETFYVWSRIGEMDFTPTLRNEEGFRRCPFGGVVYHVRRLGDSVIGYSSKGITRLVPVQAPAVTFGFVELSDIGIINQGAIDGNLRRQVFVGTDYNLYEINSAGRGVSVSEDHGLKVAGEDVQLLGYKNYIEQLADEDIIVNYDPKNKDFYIGNSTKTFLLSVKGLSEIPQHPSTVFNIAQDTYMLPDAEDDYEALIVTEAFDFGYSGQKTIMSLETDALPVDNARFAVDYYNNMLVYGTTSFKPANNQGVASLIASGNAFRIHYKFDPTYDATRISFIKARYKMTDLRGIRGVYAPPPRGQ